MNTSSSADGINKDGVIVGMGVHNGETHADAMVPVTPSPTPMPTNSNCYAHLNSDSVQRVTPTPRARPTPRSRP
jgi:hypothetical protein